MSKQSGLGDQLLVAGYDLSGDAGAIDSVAGGPSVLEVTGINKSAFERLGGLRDGRIEWTSYFNDATGAEHPVLKTRPTTDVHVMYQRGTTLGNPAASLVAKQINYDGERSDDGALTFKIEALANAYGLEWGEQMTAGLRTDTAATNGTGVGISAGTNYVHLPGTSGHYVSTPDAAALDITGDIDIRVYVAMDDWTPATDACVLAKYNTTGNQRSYNLHVLNSGLLNFQWSEDGTAQITKSSTAATGFTDGTAHWIRATLDVDNGAAGNTVTFYTSEDGTTWTQLGNTVVTAGVTSIFNSTSVLELGARNTGTAANTAGKIFQAQVRTGIGGTIVANPVAGTSSVTDSTGLTWTVNGASSFLSFATLFGGQAYLQCNAFTGTDVTVKLQHSGDNGVIDTWADITGGGFTQITSGPTFQRIALSSSTLVERYVRAVTTTSGGVTSVSFSVNFVRNLSAVSF